MAKKEIPKRKPGRPKKGEVVEKAPRKSRAKPGAKKGRPTKYDPKYVAITDEFFNIDATRVVKKTITTKGGSIIEEEGTAANEMRFIIDLADHIGVAVSTVYEWEKNMPEFSEALTRARERQMRHVILNALHMNYDSRFAGLVMKNWFGWTEREAVDHTTKGESINDNLPAPDKGKKLKSILEVHIGKQAKK